MTQPTTPAPFTGIDFADFHMDLAANPGVPPVDPKTIEKLARLDTNGDGRYSDIDITVGSNSPVSKLNVFLEQVTDAFLNPDQANAHPTLVAADIYSTANPEQASFHLKLESILKLSNKTRIIRQSLERFAELRKGNGVPENSGKDERYGVRPRGNTITNASGPEVTLVFDAGGYNDAGGKKGLQIMSENIRHLRDFVQSTAASLNPGVLQQATYAIEDASMPHDNLWVLNPSALSPTNRIFAGALTAIAEDFQVINSFLAHDGLHSIKEARCEGEKCPERPEDRIVDFSRYPYPVVNLKQ